MKSINGNTTVGKCVTYRNIKYEMIDVSANGSCFYNAMSVALAYHNQFVSSADIKNRILQRMVCLHDSSDNAWFKTLFAQYSFVHNEQKHDKERGFADEQMCMAQYIAKQTRRHAWAGDMEVVICCEVFGIEIQTFVRGSAHRHRHLEGLQNRLNIRSAYA